MNAENEHNSDSFIFNFSFYIFRAKRYKIKYSQLQLSQILFLQ